jgi:GDP-mannose 4,6-dehydratase
MIRNMITGIGGFVASHLARYLLEQGEEVYGTLRWTEDLSRIEDIKSQIHLVPMDLNDAFSCIKAIEDIKPDFIFHLAAQSYVSDSFVYPVETIRTNTLGTLNLLEAVRLVRDRYSVAVHGEYSYNQRNPVIHICSSSEVYGLVTPDLVPIKEECRFNPSNPYAVGKVGEDMLALLYWTNYGIKTIRTRMFTHTGYGRTMLSAECNFAKQIAQIEYVLSKGEKCSFSIKHGNLNSVRTWADVRDAVRAYYCLVRKGIPGEVYNIGGSTTKTIGEVLDYLISQSPLREFLIKEQDPKLMRPYDVTLQIPDCSKFKRDTGWEPIYTFEDTMKEVLRYWRNHV